MATPVKKIQIAKGEETRLIRPAFLRTWQRQGWEQVADDFVPAEPQDEPDDQLTLDDAEETGEEVPAASDENESGAGETPETDLSEDEGETSTDDSADDAKEN